jgi:hypothetical protein
VARSRCRFFNVKLLAGAARGPQFDALALEVRRLSPFAETGWHLDLGRDHAAIWLWDQGATRAAAAAVGVDIARMRVVPEPAMLPPGDDGVRLIETVDGVEGQHWLAGHLTASRWWSGLPSDRDWLMFQRGAALPPDRLGRETPPPFRLPWLVRPWTTTRRAGSLDLARIDLRLVAASVAAAAMIAYGYQGAEWWRVSRAAAGVADEVAQRSQAIEPLLEARSRALDNQSAIGLLHQFDRFPTQLSLMARVAEALPGTHTTLTAWVYDRGQLELGIAADQPIDVVKLVRALEGLDHFKSVAAERTGINNSLRLRVTLAPL